MRIGLIGVGRIGAFHARNLAALPVVEELVISDAVPALADAVGRRDRRHRGGRAGRRAGRRRGRRRHRLLDRHPPRPDPRLRAGRHPDVLREAGRADLQGSRRPWPTSSPTATSRCRSASRAASTRPTSPPATTCSPAGSATCTRCAPRRSTPHLRRRPTSSAPAASSTTARSTTSTRSGGPPARRSWRCTPSGSTQGIDYIAEAGDAETATSVLTLSGGTLAVVSNTRANGRGHDVRLELLGSAGLRVRRARRAAAAAVGRRRGRVPRPGALGVLHGPVRRRLPRRAHRVHRGRRRHAHLSLHGGRRASRPR